MDEYLYMSEVDAINHGAIECAKRLANIARTNSHSGVFGGEELEKAAQTILQAIKNAELRGVKAGLEATVKVLEERVSNDSLSSFVQELIEDTRAINPKSVEVMGD